VIARKSWFGAKPDNLTCPEEPIARASLGRNRAGYLGRDALRAGPNRAKRPGPGGRFSVAIEQFPSAPRDCCFSSFAHKAASNARFFRAIFVSCSAPRFAVLGASSFRYFSRNCSTAAVASGTICAVRWRAHILQPGIQGRGFLRQSASPDRSTSTRAHLGRRHS